MNLENLPKIRATILTMKTPSFIAGVEKADVILTFPTSSEWNPQIAYGTQTLQRIASGGLAKSYVTLCITIDWTTNEPEHLIALLRHIKGTCDLD